MEWESSSVNGEPVYTAEFSVESIAGYDSEDSNDSSVSEVDDISYDSDESFDESANQIDDCTDNIIIDTFVEDLESQDSFAPAFKIMIDRLNDNLPESADDLEPQKSNDVAFQEVLDRIDCQQKIIDAEIHELELQNTFDSQVRDLKDGIITEFSDINLLGDSLKLIGVALDKKINETIAKVCEDDTIEEDEISISEQIMADYAAGELEDIEMQFSADVDFTLDQQLNWTDDERLFQSLFLSENDISDDSISGYGIYQSDCDQIIHSEINGLGPKQSDWHKILDWMLSCTFEMSSYVD